MDYAAAVAFFFAPAPDHVATPAAVADATPARRLRDAREPLSVHAVWSEPVTAGMAAIGLDDFFTRPCTRSASSARSPSSWARTASGSTPSASARWRPAARGGGEQPGREPRCQRGAGPRPFTAPSPLGRVVDAARACTFLSSDAAASITGEDLDVNAGVAMY